MSTPDSGSFYSSATVQSTLGGHWAVSSLGRSAAVIILGHVFQGTPACSSVGYTPSIRHVCQS